MIALAVTGDNARTPLPRCPFKELGYDGFDDLRVSNGLFAPKGTSPEVIEGFRPPKW